MRTCLNLMIVFLCTGFWHGPGCRLHCLGPVLWRPAGGGTAFPEKRLEHLPGIISFLYMFFVTVIGWTMFRADSLTGSCFWADVCHETGVYDISMFMTP